MSLKPRTDHSRDVFMQPKKGGGYIYRKSSTWQRRLRRTAARHYRALDRGPTMSPKILDLMAGWKKMSRNG